MRIKSQLIPSSYQSHQEHTQPTFASVSIRLIKYCSDPSPCLLSLIASFIFLHALLILASYILFVFRFIYIISGRSQQSCKCYTLRYASLPSSCSRKHTAPDQDQDAYRPEPRHSTRVHTPRYLNNTQEYTRKGQSLCLNVKNKRGLGQTKCVSLSNRVSRNQYITPKL